MALSKDIISKFVKTTNDNPKNTKKETFVQGDMVDMGDGTYGVCIDGTSTGQVMPVSITTNIDKEKPVTVLIKNHRAVVIGNVSTDTTITGGNSIINSTSLNDIATIPIDDINTLWE